MKVGEQRPLSESEVDVWYYPLDVTIPDTLMCAMLDQREVKRANAFRFAKHRRRFVASHCTVRGILAEYVGCGPAELDFGESEKDKPFIIAPAIASTLSFNVTHSHGRGAVAVTKGNAVGLDVEEIRPIPDFATIAANHFSAAEQAWLSSLPENEQLHGFYALWTCKEAYLKGKGFGLSAALDAFSINLECPQAPCLNSSDLGDEDARRWFLRRLLLDDDVVACVAVEGRPATVRCEAWPRQ